jgi:nitronate monooxygenase
MAGSATPALAAAVSNAGGLGSLGCAGLTAEELQLTVRELRKLTSRSFNLNFFTHPQPTIDAQIWRSTAERLRPFYNALGIEPPGPPATAPEAGFTEAKLKLLLELSPPVVSFHFGIPASLALTALRQRGIAILSSATNVAEARTLVRAGVDAVICQGYEAGGHRGSHAPSDLSDGIGLMALVPQVVDAIETPVIAAGGIADGRGIVAALALGAAGVQIGTAFLSCPEAATDAARRALIQTASDTDTTVTDTYSGRSARAKRNRLTQEMAKHRKLPDFPLMYGLSDPLCEAARAAGEEDLDFHIYGQAASLNREMPAIELMQTLVAEAGAVMRSF